MSADSSDADANRRAGSFSRDRRVIHSRSPRRARDREYMSACRCSAIRDAASRFIAAIRVESRGGSTSRINRSISSKAASWTSDGSNGFTPTSSS
jgi:hypothetical protein